MRASCSGFPNKYMANIWWLLIYYLILPAFQCKTEAKFECPVGLWLKYDAISRKLSNLKKKSQHNNTCCVKHVNLDLDTRLSGSSNGITTILYSCSIGFCNSSYQLSSLVRFKTTSLNWISLVMKVDTRNCKTLCCTCRMVVILQYTHTELNAIPLKVISKCITRFKILQLPYLKKTLTFSMLDNW